MISNDELIGVLRTSVNRAAFVSGPFMTALLIMICIIMLAVYIFGVDLLSDLPRLNIYKGLITSFIIIIAFVFVHDTFLIQATKSKVSIPIAVTDNVSYDRVVGGSGSDGAERVYTDAARLPPVPPIPASMMQIPVQQQMPQQVQMPQPQYIPQQQNIPLPPGITAGAYTPYTPGYG